MHVTPPTIVLTRVVPRLYGLRLLIASGLIWAAVAVSGQALRVELGAEWQGR